MVKAPKIDTQNEIDKLMSVAKNLSRNIKAAKVKSEHFDSSSSESSSTSKISFVDSIKNYF